MKNILQKLNLDNSNNRIRFGVVLHHIAMLIPSLRMADAGQKVMPIQLCLR